MMPHRMQFTLFIHRMYCKGRNFQQKYTNNILIDLFMQCQLCFFCMCRRGKRFAYKASARQSFMIHIHNIIRSLLRSSRWRALVVFKRTGLLQVMASNRFPHSSIYMQSR